jgi:hypothetical protein
MAVYRYPPEVHEFVKEHACKLRDQELAVACNEALGTHFTAHSMKAFRGNHGYKNYKKQWSSEEYWKYQTQYPQGMYEFIRDNSWGVSSKEMAEMCNEKFGTNWTKDRMKHFRQRHGIKSGVTGWYQKGHAPGNKGKKLEEYVGEKRAAEIKKKLAPTQFKKGHAPLNEYPLGTITTSTEGYLIKKVKMEGSRWERWAFVHRMVWEEHNGPIPEGMIVSFRDSNKLNCDISNLMLISMGEHVTLTRLGLRSEDPDLTDAGVALVRLKQTMKKAKKRRGKHGKETG